MKVNCVSCGHSLDLRDGYENYDGQVKCWICGALLAIRTEDGGIKWVELVTQAGRSRAPSTHPERQPAHWPASMRDS